MSPPRPRVVLVHGTATGPSVWERMIPLLEDTYDVLAPERPRTGDLASETAWLAGVAAGAWVVGMSGGATLGLELVRSGTPLAGAVLHEPAVGSLVPDLLAPVAEAFAADGTHGLGTTLYGPSWRGSMVNAEDDVTARELAMFRSFEPGPPSPVCGTVVVTYGAASPEPRHRAATVLRDRWGYEIRAIPGARHFVAWEDPARFAAVLRRAIPDRQGRLSP